MKVLILLFPSDVTLRQDKVCLGFYNGPYDNWSVVTNPCSLYVGPEQSLVQLHLCSDSLPPTNLLSVSSRAFNDKPETKIKIFYLNLPFSLMCDISGMEGLNKLIPALCFSPPSFSLKDNFIVRFLNAESILWCVLYSPRTPECSLASLPFKLHLIATPNQPSQLKSLVHIWEVLFTLKWNVYIRVYCFLLFNRLKSI